MKKIIKKMTDDGIMQITISDERWYTKNIDEENVKYVPSVTWICSYYPKGVGFMKWLASKGWDEAEIVKTAAGDKGSTVHEAISDLVQGKTVSMSDTYLNRTSGKEEELTLQEYECLMSFVGWVKKFKPEFVASEFVIMSDEHNYAGTVDILCKINGVFCLLDIKTSANIYPSHELQVSAYRKAIIGKEFRPDEEDKMLMTEDSLVSAILQVGYARNKDKFKFTKVEDKFDLFLAAKQIWQEEAGKAQPKIRDYPIKLTLKEEEKENET